MRSRNLRRVWIGSNCLALALVLAVAGHAADDAATKAAGKLLPPPKFDSDTNALFSNDVLSKIGPGQPGSLAPKVAATAAPAGGAPTDDSGGAPVGGSYAWSKLITAESLEAEIKSLVPVAAEAVKTRTGFNGKGREQAQNALTELAALFGVVSLYDGEVRWKKDGPGLEKAFSQAGLNCKTSSDAAYNEAKRRTEELADLVRGNTPADLPKGDATIAWSELVNRPALMRRLEEAREGGRISKNVSSKSDFKKNKEAVLRESQVLAMISEIIKEPGFQSADDETYQKYLATFQQQCLALTEAIKGDKQEEAQSIFAQMGKSCDTCHGDFR